MQLALAQSPIQKAFLPWSLVETWLKKAAEANIPISITGLFVVPEIQEAARDKQQVKDIVFAYLSKGMLIKMPLQPGQHAHDKRERIGYMWNSKYEGESYRPSPRIIQRKMAQTPSDPVVTRPEGPRQITHDGPQAVELEFKGVTLTISRNTENGNMRIVIEG